MCIEAVVRPPPPLHRNCLTCWLQKVGSLSAKIFSSAPCLSKTDDSCQRTLAESCCASGRQIKNGWVHSRYLFQVVLFAMVLGQSTGIFHSLMTCLISALAAAGLTCLTKYSILLMPGCLLSTAGSLHSLRQCRFDHQAQHPSSRQCTICGTRCSRI